MNDIDFDALLTHGANAVLETMFFSEALPPADADVEGSVVEARVAFDGEPSGCMGIRISEASARSLAAAFLGAEEESIDKAQSGQVVRELANMLCGWVLSQLEYDRHFDLGSPQLLSGDCEKQTGFPPAFEKSFAIEKGILTVALYLNTSHES